MRSGRHPRPGDADGGRAFDPWAPRGPGGSGPAVRPSTPPTAPGPSAPRFDVGASSVSAPAADGRANPEPGWHPGAHAPGSHGPVRDDGRPPGAGAQPPTSWPAPRLDPSLAPTPDPPDRRRGGALVAFVAFLVGATMVGVAFGAYALGVRADGGTGTADETTTTTELRATGDLDIQALLDIARPSVVTIQTGGPDSVFGGAGSGVVISEDGLILTNAHVIEGAGGEISVRFSDGSTASAELVGASTSDDIALIQARASGLTPATLGSSANLLVGDPVVAIGNALNLGGDPSVTSGIVSAKDREISDGTISLDDLIQTDAAINPGNSGGPLLNANGEVVGINTAIIAGAQNVGFAIAIDSVEVLISELQDGGGDLTADTAVLGTSAVDVSSLSQEDRDLFGVTVEQGALVVAVDPAGGAGAAGIVEGDVIVEVDGTPVANATELTRTIRSYAPGDEVSIAFERAGARQTVTVVLGP